MRPKFSVTTRTCFSKNGPCGCGVSAVGDGLERLDDLADAVRRHRAEQAAGLGDLDERARRAQAQAADALDLDVGQAGVRDRLAQAEW